MSRFFLLFAALGLLASSIALYRRRRLPSPRQQALRRVLDSADALEGRLRQARDAVHAMPGSDDDPVRVAMQEMLQRRLWLQEHGDTAPVEQLDDVRAALDAARARLDVQLRG